MIIAERLRLLRREKGLSKKDLVAKMPINYSTYANYESGFREPNSEVLQVLSRHFEVSIDFIIGATDSRMRVDEMAMLTDAEHAHLMLYRTLDAHGRSLVDMIMEKEAERVNFPHTRGVVTKGKVAENRLSLRVYHQRASAGLGAYLGDDSDKDYEMRQFEASPVSEKADFCVRIYGDSMEPKITDGDIVFVKAVPKVEDDNIGIFVYEGESYCKQLRIDHKRSAIFLESLNKSYASKRLDNPEQLRTVGLVLGVATPLPPSAV